MGRPRTSNAIKQLRGTDQPCRMADELPVAPIDRISPPAWLSPTAKRVFREKSAQLCACRVMTMLDADTLALYAESLATAIEATRHLKKDGIIVIVRDKDDNIVGQSTNLWHDVQKKAIKQATEIGAMFGFSPVSRLRLAQLAAPAPEKKNEFEEFEEV